MLAIAAMAPPALAHTSEDEWRDVYKAFEYDQVRYKKEAHQALAKARGTGDKVGELRALRMLTEWAHLGFYGDDRPILDDELERGASLARELNDQEAMCTFLVTKGYLAALDGRVKDGMAAFHEAAGIAERHSLKTRLAWIYHREGSILNKVGRDSEVAKVLPKAYEIFEAEGDRYGMARVLDVMAMVTPASDQRALRMGEDYLERALGMIDENVYRHLAAEYYLRLSMTHFWRGDIAGVRPLVEKALLLARENGDHGMVAIARFYFARLAREERRFDDVLREIDRALPGLRDPPSMRMRTLALLMRAEASAHQGRRKEALDSLAEALRAGGKMDLSVEAIYHETAALVHKDLGDLENAFAEMKKARDTDRKVTAVANERLADELKVRFEVQLWEKENAALRAQRTAEDANRTALALALALSVGLFVSVAVYLRRRAATARVELAHQQELAAAEASRADAEAQANLAKTAFLASMSHELRSPLNAMLGFTRLLMRDSSLASHRDDLGIVLRSGEHLYRLINEVLEMSKIEAGRMELSESDFDVPAMLEEIEEMFALQARHKGIKLTVQCDAGVPRYARADAGKLRQVLINLTSNAVKFTAHGRVELRAQAQPGAKLELHGDGHRRGRRAPGTGQTRPAFHPGAGRAARGRR